MRKSTTLAAVLAGMVGSAAGGWALAANLKTPAQAALEAGPPQPSAITAPVELQTLSADLIVRGAVRFGRPRPLLLADPPASGDGASVVTLAPEQGAVITEGSVLLEVSGRPVFGLQGELPMYRTLRLGTEGADVLQLEQALDRLGVDVGAIDGRYDAATEAAVAAWYGAAGYEPQAPTLGEQEALAGAAAAVDEAAADVRSAERALADARKPPPQSALLASQASVAAARRAVDDAIFESERSVAAASSEAAAAQRTAEATFAAEVVARDRLAVALAGAHPDTGLPPTPDELAALDAAAAQAAAAYADAAVDLAAAQDALAVANRTASSTLADARDSRAIARAAHDELVAPAPTGALEEVLADVRERLAAAETRLTELRAEIGLVVPRSELVFFDELPLRIDTVAVARGDAPEGEVAQITDTRLAIDSAVAAADVESISVGARVTIDEEVRGITTRGTVTVVADRPGTDGANPGSVYVEIVPDDALNELSGASVRITIPIESTGGDVLTVPVAALSASADGSVRVEVQDADGTIRPVAVELGLSTLGFVAVDPIDGTLAAGDWVVVGQQ